MGIQRFYQFPEGSGSLSGDDVFLFMDNPSSSGVTKKIALSDLIDAIGVVAISGEFNTGDITFDGSTISTANTDQNMTITTNGSGDIYIGADRNMIFDMNAWSAKGIILQDSQEDGYDDPGTPSTLKVGSIYHDTGTMVIKSDGRIVDSSGNLLQVYGGLWITNGDDTGLRIPPPTGSPIGSGEFQIRNNEKNWTFTPSGDLVLPVSGDIKDSYGNSVLGGAPFSVTTVDLHNGGVQNAQVLQFTDGDYQSVITGPTPASGISSQRIIIQGQRAQGNAEGGDVYLWGGDANANGGDIKIYAGDADNNESPSYGGYINIDAGNGFDNGGTLSLSAGASTNAGGHVYITAGYSQSGQAGSVEIAGGSSSNGMPGPVVVRTNNNTHSWTFNNSADLEIPGKIILPNYTTVATGTFDNSTGDNNGISLNCYVGYELNWQGGHLMSTQDNGMSAANIQCDSPIEFPGSGTDNVQIDNAGVTFSDGSTQTMAGIVSNPAGIGGALSISNIVQISQSDYDNLLSKDSSTLYIIND